jgi:hypothetical protein
LAYSYLLFEKDNFVGFGKVLEKGFGRDYSVVEEGDWSAKSAQTIHNKRAQESVNKRKTKKNKVKNY